MTDAEAFAAARGALFEDSLSGRQITRVTALSCCDVMRDLPLLFLLVHQVRLSRGDPDANAFGQFWIE